MFETIVEEQLGHYVYALFDPRDHKPFYIGKGVRSRLFAHLSASLEAPTPRDKCERIRDIIASGLEVEHVLIRHGLDEKAAFEIESALIDFCERIGHPLTNIAGGFHSKAVGLMTANEATRRYAGKPLEQLEPGTVLININRTYRRAKGTLSYYDATKESWVIGRNRVKDIRVVLSEYRGFVVEAFEVHEWYPVPTSDRSGKPRTRWGFHGERAPAAIRDRYVNRRVTKLAGAANPIRFSL